MSNDKFPELVYLSSNLRKYRKRCSLTQDDLADRTGCHRTYISALERGRVNPTLSTLSAISRVLGTDVVHLLLDTTRWG